MNAPTKPFPLGLTLLIVLALLLSSALAVTPVIAADTIMVINHNDSGAGSLRQAIDYISLNGNITFDPSLSGETITLSSTLNIQKNMKIYAGDLDQPVTISGDEKVRVFYVNDSVTNAELNHLTISHGKVLDEPHSTSGGGIFNLGHLTLINCTLSDNQTDWIGGAIYNGSTLNVENSHFLRNQSKGSGGGYGGAIANWGTMNVINSIFTDNQSTDHIGGGIANFANMEISASSFSDNSAGYHGGGIYNSGNMMLTNSTLSDNSSAGNGGGIHNEGTLTLLNVMLNENTAYDGGGISNFGNLEITNSTLSGNQAGKHGGGILSYNKLTITNSTINGNTAVSWGGGIHFRGNLEIINSTLSGNMAGSYGGGIDNDAGYLMIRNSTLYGNGSGHTGGGIWVGGTLNFANTIIAHSTSGGDCINAGTIHTDSTHNLVTDGSCGGSNNNPLLDDLADNGGPTLTHALLPGSPAIDAGNDVFCPSEDQRGVSRPQDGDGDGVAHCDIGAFELASYHLVVINSSDNEPGSLRKAIADIQPGGRITFSSSLSGQTITLASPLQIDKNLTIDGSGLAVPITISGNNAVGVFNVGPSVDDATLESLKIIRGNRGAGGGIFNMGALMVTNCTVSDNNAQEDGGGIYNMGELTILNSTLSGNNATDSGGGIYNLGVMELANSTLFGNSAIFGGGIFNLDVRLLDESTFSVNMSNYDAGIFNDEFSQRLDVINSTLSGNTAVANGGGIFNRGNLSVGNSTLYGNVASYGGGIVNWSEFLFINTIIAGSTDGDCVNQGSIHDDSTHNLVQDGSCNADFSGDPMLGPLANNGGPTWTHALLPASPAIDAAHPDYCSDTDQRGVSRPQGEACDIGSFEYDIVLLYLPLIMK